MNGELAYASFLKQSEKKQVRSAANFVGFLLIALLMGQLLLGGLMAFLSKKGWFGNDLNSVGLLLYDMLEYVVCLGLPVLLVAVIARRGISPFPTRRVPKGTYLLAIFGGMALSFFANIAASIISSFLIEQGAPEPVFTDIFEPTAENLLLNLLCSAVLPALFEEMTMRGYMLSALRPCGDKLAIGITAVLFGLVHGNIIQVPFALILGLLMGWLTVQTGSIWPAVVFHFSNNALSVLLGWLEQFTEDGNSLTTVVFLLCSLAGAIVFFAAFLKHRRYGDDLLRPVGNGTSVLSVGARVFTILTAPAFLVGGITWLAVLILSMIPW